MNDFKMAVNSFVMEKFPDRKAGDCTYVFWWDDHHPVFEFPIVNKNGRQLGYVICNEADDLPFVFEYVADGPLLSTTVLQAAFRFHDRISHEFDSVKLYYFSPLDIVLRIGDGKHTVYHALPNGKPFVFEDKLNIKRDPRRLFEPQKVTSYRSQISPAPNLRDIDFVLGQRSPVSYLQTHRTIDGISCIAGCAPVALAMFLSSLKKDTRGDAMNRIWNVGGGGCWQEPWRDGPVCPLIDDDIWGLHSAMQTGCDGSTYYDKQYLGLTYFEKWDIRWQYEKVQEPSLDYVYNVMYQKWQTLILSAQSEWGVVVRDSTGINSLDGHSVVIFGKGENVANDNFWLVNLGWGTSFGDDFAHKGSKWINVATLQNKMTWTVLSY